MMVSKKILVVDNALYQTGALKSIMNFARALHNDCEFIFVLPENSTAVEIVADEGYRVYTLPILEISKSPKVINYLPRLLKNTKRLLQIIDKEQIDVLHINDVYNMLGCSVKRKRPSLPVVYHVRLLASSYISKFYGSMVRMVKRYADKIIYVSEVVERDAGKTAQSTIINDATDIEPKMAPWNGLQSPEQASVLYLSNFAGGKGQQFGLQAFKEVVTQFPSVKLYFTGGADNASAQAFRQLLIDQSAQMGLDGQVIFEPKVTNVEAKMKSADIVLNLSESESFSMVSLEALAFGVPLVVSDCGGPVEITDKGRYADLVPNKDPKAAAAAIINILRNPEAAKTRAKNGMTFVRERFNTATVAKSLLNIYEKVISKHQN